MGIQYNGINLQLDKGGTLCVKNKTEQWGSRWGFIAAALGMAIGTGNIWRFPRIAASNGGGTFLIAWTIALLVWSIPLLIAEMVIGRRTRQGTIGAFRDFVGKKFTWMGTWIAWVCVAIMAYYAVVMGWTMKYFGLAVTGALTRAEPTVQSFEAIWEGFLASPVQTSTYLIISFIIGGFIVYRGIKGGIERASKILIPSLFFILIVCAIRSVTLPGAAAGLTYLFKPDLSQLLTSTIWLQAFTQSAWSTGAGWGFIITYAVYTKEKEDIGLNCFITGFGDNSGSLLAGLAVIPAIFALSGTQAEVEGALSAGNTGLAFIYFARLFQEMPGGRLLATFFFLAMAVAALTSLLPMIEVGVRVLMDRGWTRSKATTGILTFGILLGLPSAISNQFLENQDFVWGVGLMVSGLFVAIAILRYGAERLRRDEINTEWNDLKIGRWWNWCIALFPVMFIFIFGWWIVQSIGWYPDNWWNPLETYSPGSIFAQFILAIAIFMIFNRWFAQKPGETQ